MKSSSVGTILGLALLFALVAGGYFLFKYVTGVFNTLDPQIETLTWITSIVAVLCAVIIAEGLKACRPVDATAAEKSRVYGELLFVCCERLGPGGAGASAADANLARLEQSLALLGAARVVSAYADVRRLTGKHEPQDDTSATLLIKLLTEMRADLGNSALVRNENDLRDMLLGRR